MRSGKIAKFGLFCVLFVAYVVNCHAFQEGSAKSKVWQLLDSMANRMPLTKESFGTIMHGEPWLDEQGERRPRWRTDPIALSEDLGIHDAEIIFEGEGGFYAAGFDVAGACIHVRDVRDKYGPLVIVDTPKGHSLFDDTIYQSQQGWGSFYFIFLDIAPDCLSSVTVSKRREKGI